MAGNILNVYCKSMVTIMFLIFITGIVSACIAAESYRQNDKIKEKSKLIKGVAPLKWNNGQNTYISALTEVLRAKGEKTDYTELMGLSGAAFRLQFHLPKGCPSSPDATCGFDCSKPALEAMGYSGRHDGVNTDEEEDKKRIRKTITDSIDNGYPVLAIDLIGVADWGVITGYAKNGEELLCKTFHNKSNLEEKAEKFPWAITTLEKKKDVKNRKEIFRKSLEIAVLLAKTEKFESYASGSAAFDAWRKYLCDASNFSDISKDELDSATHTNAWIYASLLDARAAAMNYLNRYKDLLGESVSAHLVKAADLYKKEVDLLVQGRKYAPFVWELKDGAVWKPFDRYKEANILYRATVFDKAAIAEIEKALKEQSREPEYSRSNVVTQVADTQNHFTNNGDSAMSTKRSKNMISIIHRLVTDEYGENYWFNGCAKYVMEALNEPDYDYWFFAGLTGDVFTQHYTYDISTGDALSCYMMDENPEKYIEDIFSKCGYAATFIPLKNIRKNTEMYLNTLTAYIDKGIPVIKWGGKPGVYVGYDDYGKVLLFITGNSNEPERIPLEKALQDQAIADGWIFAGEKKENYPLPEIYRKMIGEILKHQSIKTNAYCFGPEAFRAWARDIETGKFDKMTSENFSIWSHYTNYVCVLATNGSCCHEVLKRAQKLNTDMFFLDEISRLYRRMAEMWGGDIKQNDEDSLEALGGGFNVTLDVLQDKTSRAKIAVKIREFANVNDEIMRVLQANLHNK